MAKIWKESLDATRHRDHRFAGSGQPRGKNDPLILQWAYFVRVCGFTFEFPDLKEIEEYLHYYSTKILPSERYPVFVHEKGEWQTKFGRLPAFLREDSRRPRVVKALKEALAVFRNDT